MRSGINTQSQAAENPGIVSPTGRHRRRPPGIPAIVPDGIYTRAQIEINLGIGPDTLTSWVDFNGLRLIQPGTRSQFLLGSEVIAFMLAHRDGIYKPKTAKEKAAIRKAGAK